MGRIIVIGSPPPPFRWKREKFSMEGKKSLKQPWNLLLETGVQSQSAQIYSDLYPETRLTCWDEESLALLQSAFVTLVHLVGEEHLAVVGRRPPALVQGQVRGGGLDQEEDLLPLKQRGTSWD